MSARKVRAVIRLIKGKNTADALTVLENTPKRSAQIINKLLRSAIANARQKGAEEEGLYIAKIFADEGPTWKRFQANAFGRASRIRKRTCHITVELDRKIVVPKTKIAGRAGSQKTKRVNKKRPSSVK
jgi:large subunit ribosomal protein L22